MHFLCCLFVLALFYCTIITVSAEDPFTTHSFDGGNSQTLPYRQLSPETMTPGKRYPLVIFLHGAGERGSDNDKQLKNVARIFSEDANRKAFPCFVIAPQCPEGKRWCEVDWSDAKPHKTPEQPSDPMKLLLKLIDQLRQQPNIDHARLYVMGLSMGGFGTWDLVTRRPGQFAAAIPICGGGDVEAAPQLNKLPLWLFHGDQDTVVKTVRSQLMVEALKKAGSTVVRYTEYPGVAHNSWTPASKEAELLPWLFEQHRAQ